MQPNLQYFNQGREGFLIYKDDQSEIKFYYEFGGGDCIVIIFVPTTEEWTGKTNRPLADRQPVLTFVAEQSIKDQAPNCYFVISETYIEIFKNENK